VLRREEYSAVDAVLSAAALTYVAGLVMALLELLRLVAIFRGMDDRD
jgi:Zn-dependent membrane protease YugP